MLSLEIKRVVLLKKFFLLKIWVIFLFSIVVLNVGET